MVKENSEIYSYGGSPSKSNRTGIPRSKSTGPCRPNMALE